MKVEDHKKLMGVRHTTFKVIGGSVSERQSVEHQEAEMTKILKNEN